MDRKMLRDDQWERIKQHLPGKKSDPGCTPRITGASSRPPSGLCARVGHGAVIHQNSAIGTARM